MNQIIVFDTALTIFRSPKSPISSKRPIEHAKVRIIQNGIQNVPIRFKIVYSLMKLLFFENLKSRGKKCPGPMAQKNSVLEEGELAGTEKREEKKKHETNEMSSSGSAARFYRFSKIIDFEERF
jgi:hypothetical protein